MQRYSGKVLELMVEGESHSKSISFELYNVPQDFKVNQDELQVFMRRRAPGRDELSTSRYEEDEVRLNDFECGIIGVIDNKSINKKDYDEVKKIPRPGHADFGQWISTGNISSGGGLNSGRMTVALCGAGGICLQFLKGKGISISATLESVHGKTTNLEDEILEAKKEGDSVGGIVRCKVTGVKAGLGGALFQSLESDISRLLFAIPGVKGVEFGNGFEATKLRGSENNDEFIFNDGEIKTSTNRCGGILGGRTTGMPIEFNVAFKPTPTIFKEQKSVNLETMEDAISIGKGRHDPCIARRAVPVVEAVAAFVIADLILYDERNHSRICLTLTGETLEENIEQYKREKQFVDLLELRSDFLSEKERENACKFASLVDRPVILTFRRAIDGGKFNGEEKTRVNFFKAILKSENKFKYVDLEDDFIKTREGKAIATLAIQNGIKIIQSLHVFNESLETAIRKFNAIKGSVIPKLAFMPRSREDVESMFEIFKRRPSSPRIICAMGKLGLPTRIRANKIHSFLTYASFDKLEELGHITPRQIKTAKKFGVIGHPISHSLSPEIQEENFKEAGIVATYERFDAEEENDLFNKLMDLKEEGFSGVNITLPHKINVIRMLDGMDESVMKYESCNTIKFLEDGTIVGFNTDVVGFRKTLESLNFSLKKKRVCIVGHGGVAQALFRAAIEDGVSDISMFGRNAMDNARKCAKKADLIINATPVGLKKGDKSVLPRNVFRKGQVVLDLIPTREFPPTAALAKEAGATAVDGLYFLKQQAIASFKIWMGT